MKFNFKTVLTSGAIALAGFAAGVAFSLTPAMAEAQTVATVMQLPEALEQLNLTEAQEDQLVQIRQETRAQLESLLSEEQRNQFKSTMEAGGSLREAIAAMNLSETQQTELRSIFSSARQEAAAVLTDDQRQQVREFIRVRLQELR
jgi:Spy/CpxP family protein refolding chaperone